MDTNNNLSCILSLRAFKEVSDMKSKGKDTITVVKSFLSSTQYDNPKSDSTWTHRTFPVWKTITAIMGKKNTKNPELKQK